MKWKKVSQETDTEQILASQPSYSVVSFSLTSTERKRKRRERKGIKEKEREEQGRAGKAGK